jgi:hypothetical protein
MAYLKLDEDTLLVHRATGTIAHTGDMEQCIEVEATKYCNMANVLEDKAEPSCQGAIWRSEWAEATKSCPIRMVRATATVWALEKDEFWVVLPNTTECTFTCGTKPPQTRQIKGQHRVRLGDKCSMSSMHFSTRPATQADGRKITMRQAVVNFTGWQAASSEEQIFRAETTNDGYQIRAKEQLERGESGKNWPLIILAILLGLLAAAIVAAGATVFMFRKRIITGLVAATLGPRTTEKITAVVQATTEEHKVKKEKATGAKQKGQRSRTRPHKKEERTFEGLEKLTKFMVSPQHSMGDGYAIRPCDNCWDGKSTRDIDKGVLPTLCTGCETRKGPFASEQKQIEVWER